MDWHHRAGQLKLAIRDFVAGQWRSGSDGSLIRKSSPRDGSVLYEFHPTDVEAVDAAVASARLAADVGRWSGKSPQERKDALLRLAGLLEANREDFALRECLDVGKPIREALGVDVPLSVQILKYNAESTDKLPSEVYAADHSNLAYQLRRPVGVVAAIVGWNFPLVLAAQKIAPALAAGNTVVIKPSELTCLSVSRLAELAVEAGIPEGVLNVIHGGSKVGEQLARHSQVDLLTFTGSTSTGKRLLISAGTSNMKRLILECGGKGPNIVFDDAPSLDSVADAIVARAFWNQGEVCSASSRLLVQESVKDQLLELIVHKAERLKPGDPLNPQTTSGALVSAGHQEKVLGYIELGVREGARVALRGTAIPPVTGGYYLSPTILEGVQSHQAVAQEEIFGPVLSVLSFQDEEEAIRIANSTRYGLTAIAWTESMSRGLRLAQAIHAGEVVVNGTATPRGGPNFGVLPVGGHKESGIGVEGGREGIEAYTSHSAVQIFF